MASTSAVMRWVFPALVLSTLSLGAHRALAFDPEAWVVWGREVWSLSVDTSAGPSWKPLPVLFTAPFAAFGDAAPWLWLAVARAGALLALAGAYLLAERVAGRLAGAVAVVLIAVSPWWAFNAALGNAEPLLAGCVLWAAVAHRAGRPRAAFALACAAGLIRPEVWPFLAGYGLWLARRGDERWPVVLGGGAAVLALWVVPDALASGLRSTRGAVGSPSEGSAGLDAVPFAAVWEDAFLLLGAPAALAAVVVAVRRPGEERTWLAAALAYVLLVGVMAQGGFAGNPRYLVPALAVAAAVAACAVALAGRARTRRNLVAVGLALGSLVLFRDDLREQRADLARRADIRRELDRVIERAGGRDRLKRCGPVRTGPDQRALVARVVREPVPVAGARGGPADPRLLLQPDGTWTVAGCPMPG